MTLEESIKMLQNQRKVYLDNELQNMIIRADGVYETNKTELAYPDKYLDDIKQSISTINDSVKKDLQEYRLNIHLASQKNN
jgi:dGTP triphosphohydrolase